MTATVSRARLRVLFAFFAVATLVLSARLAYWQTFGRGDLLSRATDQVRTDLVVPAQRGVIRDRAGAILATTVELRSLYAIPGLIADREAAAGALAPILGERAAVIRAVLDSGAEWLFLRRRLPEETAARVAALGIKGLGFEKEPKRLYPNGSIAAQLLGFVNDDGLGQYGVEGRYEDVLHGAPGRLVVERDPANRELALGVRTGVPARHGEDLVLTVDLAVQTAAERELAAAIQRERATGGTVVVLDPRDGAVLAIASSPTYDPARVASANAESLRDRAISWTYEPGSTLKAITIAAALDKGAVTPKTTYDDVGYAVIGGRRLSNAQGKVYGPTNVTQILARSQNAGAVFVASKLGAPDLYAYLRAFGFGERSGVDLAAETTGSVRPLAEWYPVDLGTISFGQGVSVTPLQLASAYAAIANGGTLYRPYVVASRRDADGEHRTAPVALRRVISAETSATLRGMLTATVDDGIANAAALARYSVAGKTGTAQIPSDDGRYADDAYISSFAGFVPAEDPRMVVVVVLERPQSKLLGTLPAMAAFKGIATDALRYARVQPDRP
ncbi:MAG TPA: penicillin-binding protein 2 [Candidatus Limnocylindria bacterium]|nr:penicillin-binding protein 2 [Candidatus Limnocylindria bacterium]